MTLHLPPLLVALAEALRTAPPSQAAIAERIARVWGEGQPWMLHLADRWLRSPPTERTWPSVVGWLHRHPFVLNAEDEHPTGYPEADFVPRRERRDPRFPWSGPALPEVGTLAAWLDWTPALLEGHVDARDWHRHQPAFRDYVYHWRGRRLVEAPKDRLKTAQRLILREILESVPVHPAAHGFVKGRSVHSHAALHAGQPWVARIDLRSFFPSVNGARVAGFFEALGYPSRVVAALTGLTTTWTPADICNRAPYNQPHLPQGAPTSPALANAVCWTLDARLTAWARGADVVYSRYADDLTFSGGRPGPNFLRSVVDLVEQEGFVVNRSKTRVMKSSRRQRVTGLVVNQTPAVSRRERDQLRAIVHRAEHQGWRAVDVPHPDPVAWVRGRIAWVTAAQPAHGAPLQAAFERSLIDD